MFVLYKQMSIVVDTTTTIRIDLESMQNFFNNPLATVIEAVFWLENTLTLQHNRQLHIFLC